MGVGRGRGRLARKDVVRHTLAGESQSEIARRYGVSPQYVHRIVHQETLPEERMAVALGPALASARRAEAQDLARLVERYGRGITPAIYAEITAQYNRTPFLAFEEQRQNAARSSLSWRLTFMQWWSLWQASGKWAERGRSRYGLGRKNPRRGFSVANCEVMRVTDLAMRGRGAQRRETPGAAELLTARIRRQGKTRMAIIKEAATLLARTRPAPTVAELTQALRDAMGIDLRPPQLLAQLERLGGFRLCDGGKRYTTAPATP